MIKILTSALFAVMLVLMTLMIGKSSNRTPNVDIIKSSGEKYEAGTVVGGGERNGSAYSTIETRRLLTRRPINPYIVIDRYSNKLFLRTTDSIILEALCSTGYGGELVDTLTGRRWRFETPPGVFVVNSKIKNPWWRKPDWAFIEEGLSIPENDAERFDDRMMGDYAIGFGNGFFIHGTIYERLLGVAVTHGCVRLAAPDLKKLYENTEIGTIIYVF